MGDITTRFKQFEIKVSDQKEVNNTRFENIEKELREINRRLKDLEDKQQNMKYEDRTKGFTEEKFEERLRKLEEKGDWLGNKMIDEKQLQLKIENFERMRKNSKDKNSANFQEDILNEINNLYSVGKNFKFSHFILFFFSVIKKKPQQSKRHVFRKPKYQKKSGN